jgi:hypothetical protein
LIRPIIIFFKGGINEAILKILSAFDDSILSFLNLPGFSENGLGRVDSVAPDRPDYLL